ncbi:MAG: ribonuclease P protein component [Firmicutes bacterium]|jgi:ribonuclease P protein component|nr:ribonuclease P protein component [Bacillota bacterium]MCL5971492.1 ribonuclease P protein component [Bacillota bacterium]
MRRSLRLKKRAEFGRVFKQGHTFGDRYMVLFVLFTGEDETKIGVAAQRSAGSAVKRNRVRRRLRALVQGYDDRLIPCGHIVVLGKSSVVSASWEALERSFERLMVKAKCLKS